MQGNKPGKKRRKNPNQSGNNLCKQTNQAKKKKEKKEGKTNPLIIFCQKPNPNSISDHDSIAAIETQAIESQAIETQP